MLAATWAVLVGERGAVREEGELREALLHVQDVAVHVHAVDAERIALEHLKGGGGEEEGPIEGTCKDH
jgi:hypothetical protein